MSQTQASGVKGRDDKFLTKPIIIVFLTIFIDLVGFGIVIPALPYYAKAEQFLASPRQIGLLFASYSAMQFIFAPVLGGLSDKYGRRPVLFLSLMGSAVGYLFLGFATTITMLFVGRIIAGITGGNIATAQAYIADVTSRENRAKGMGLFGAAFGLGFVFGPAIGGILSRYGIHVPFMFAAALTFANAIALYFVLPESLKPEDRKSNETKRFGGRFLEMFDTLLDARFSVLIILYFLLVTAFSIMTATFALYTMFRFEYDAEANGYLFAYIGILAVILQGFLFGRFAKRFGEAWLTVFGSFILAGALVVIPFIGPNWGGLTALLVSIAFFALGNSITSPALSSLASKTAGEGEQGKTMGAMQGSASLARAVGPAIGGILLNNAMDEIDDYTIFLTFWTAAAIMFVTLFVAIYFAQVKMKVLEEN